MAWHTGNTPTTGAYLCRRLRIPDEQSLVIAVNGALSALGYEQNWEQVGTLTPDEAEQFMLTMLLEYFEDDMCGLGRIEMFARDTLPPNVLPCDGSQYAKADYPLLYEVLPASLKVSADYFVTPDLRDKFVVATGVDYAFGDTGGESEHTLTTDELPAHNHTTQAHSHTTQPHSHTTQPHTHSETGAIPTIINGGVEAPANAATPSPTATGVATVIVDVAGVTVDNTTVIVDNTGNDQPHNNLPPYYAVVLGIVAR